MKYFGLVVALASIFSTAALASPGSYQCTIVESLMLGSDGSLTRPPKPWLLGERFAVDRNTGALVGPDHEVWSTASSRYSVLSRGNSENAFKVLVSEPLAKNGFHATLVTVEEYISGKKKPFVVVSGSTIASGTCE